MLLYRSFPNPPAARGPTRCRLGSQPDPRFGNLASLESPPPASPAESLARVRGWDLPGLRLRLESARRSLRAITVVPFVAIFACQPEIHLLLEAIHLGDLHLHFVPHANHAPIPPSGQLAARLVELVEIVRDAGQVNQPAHRQARHVHEETKVPQVN